jgi:hypothetical protein
MERAESRFRGAGNAEEVSVERWSALPFMLLVGEIILPIGTPSDHYCMTIISG